MLRQQKLPPEFPPIPKLCVPLRSVIFALPHMQIRIESYLDTDDFNMSALVEGVLPQIEELAECKTELRAVRETIGQRAYKKLAQMILRHVFLIELVKVPAIETTKFRVRWFAQLHNDPRWCSFEECLSIASTLLCGLRTWLAKDSNLEVLSLFADHSILPYEAPIDYVERPGDVTSRIHRLGNIAWVCTPEMLRTLRLRKYLLGADSNHDRTFFKLVLDKKIKIKTYLTDRVLTGHHKTNREKRWETHPLSVHFASRATAMAIESTLVTQLCCFEDFPAESRTELQNEGILPTTLQVFTCPITRERMSFPAFRDALMNPLHGKSDFQVGHLNPLKNEGVGPQTTGHTPANISWISADGNRIQGSLNLVEVQALLRRIAANYTWA